MPDLLSSKLGIKQLSPPFMEPELSEDDIRTGVSLICISRIRVRRHDIGSVEQGADDEAIINVLVLPC